MSLISKPSPVTRTAVVYVTVGALTDVWSGIWYLYLRDKHPTSEEMIYWCYGFLLTGLTLIFIGLALGWIARIGRIGRFDRPARYLGVLQEQAEEVDAIFTDDQKGDARHGEVDKIVPVVAQTEPMVAATPLADQVNPTEVSTMVVDVNPIFPARH